MVIVQILRASGVNMVTGNQNSGWWHRSQTVFIGMGTGTMTVHEHSTSWINADTFVRYMGVGYRSTNHQNFAANIRQYDFIAFDTNGTGSWDHVAYVTDRNNGSAINYNGKVFVNYRIAQHTTDYHRWASDTGWPNLQNGSTVYGRVRR